MNEIPPTLIVSSDKPIDTGGLIDGAKISDPKTVGVLLRQWLETAAKHPPAAT